MKPLLVAIALSGLTLLGAAKAHAGTVVVELFTSQGCSSCPPADKLLGELAQTRPDVISLSLHVDYWDYLGWKDAFAKSQFTDRQRAYAKAAGSAMVYTPQMIIAGQTHIVGTKAMELANALQHFGAAPVLVDLIASRVAGKLQVTAHSKAGARLPQSMILHLVRYAPKQTVEISSGENAGKTITYHNVVTHWARLSVWDGQAPLDVEAGLDGDAPAVVILQDGTTGPILAAARVD